MEDVIFNGSSARKPVGQASVELVFDNTDGSLGGEYARFNEISVKRVANREGASAYYLNGTRCRRRDITDIFLGTGLGPRSYAIIEQGMISRLIEAKPEDMRVYLEEAAGISKYKERRRETENRIRHTRENLERLNDLRDEVDKHIDHLARQKRTAEKYKALKADQRQRQAELLALRWQDMADQLAEHERNLGSEQTRLEEIVAEQRRAEAEIESAREEHHTATEAFNEIQGRYYRIGAEISSTEQQIQNAKERQQRARDELSQVEREHAETAEHIRADCERLEQLDAALAEDQPQQEELKASQDASAKALEAAEQAMRDWQAEWDDFQARAAEPVQQAQVQRSRMEQLERHIEQARKRLQRIESERGELDTDAVSTEIDELVTTEEAATEEVSRLQGEYDALEQALTEARQTEQDTQQRLDAARGEHREASGRVTSLEALQQAALGQADERVVTWLQQQGVGDAPRLAQQLRVQDGWEQAVEVVLGPFLEAVRVDRVDDLAHRLDDLDGGGVAIVDQSPANQAAAGEAALADKVGGEVALQPLLAGVGTCDDVATALRRRSELAPGESLITPDGVWIGRNWLRVARPAEDEQSVLAREQQLADAREALAHAEERVAALSAELEAATEQVRNLEQQREQTQQVLNQAHRRQGDLASKLEGKRMRLEQIKHRRDQLEQEAQELRDQIEREQADYAEAEAARNRALEQSEALEDERRSLRERYEHLTGELERARERARADRDEGHRIELRVESTKSSRDATAQNLERMEARLQQLEQRRADLQASLEGSDDPIRELEAELNAKLEQRVTVENEMNEARQRLESIEKRMRELEQTRADCERRAGEARSAVEHARMQANEVRVRRETLEEQLAELDQHAQQLLERLDDDATADAWAEHVDELERKIQRLGAVNLAAIDEYDEQVRRKEYLDSQHSDVTDALETLESAIAKIDRETRSRFKATFDAVNQHLQGLFPRLFGGGQAHLEMTGDDLLSTGVTIMARPPGKRVAHIHLLSGGEKALTAVALVFAFFELNPAPFCILDEVDAPLDDANVGRYCELVREMADRVQFIFITHNKQTMELTKQLHGVTMREAGVSRLVAVDVEEAAELADA